MKKLLTVIALLISLNGCNTDGITKINRKVSYRETGVKGAHYLATYQKCKLSRIDGKCMNHYETTGWFATQAEANKFITNQDLNNN